MLTYTLSANDFITLFDEFDRSENFSRRARQVLFDYLDGLSDDIDEDISIDIIGLCCNWAEYSASELLSEYSHMIEEEDTSAEELAELLKDSTTVITVEHGPGFEDSYLVEAF